MTAIDRRAKGLKISGRYGVVVKGNSVLFKGAVRKLSRNPTLTVKQVFRHMAIFVGYGESDFNLCPQCGYPCLDVC